MKIGQVAETTGLPVKTLRFYEDTGLLPQRPRTESGYRIFDERDLERLDFVKRAKRLGLSLTDIKDVLAITDQGEATCIHVRELLAAKVEAVEQAMRELAEFRAALVELLEQAGPVQDCRPTGGRVCGIIEHAPPVVQPAVLQQMVRGSAKGVR
ncbi:MAG: heavy metal-responsive transcriptional regulator [Chloroflexi bacterium]|nr:heavy metal-responsive transcriptional regulator [Chloroflexota bacterium]